MPKIKINLTDSPRLVAVGMYRVSLAPVYVTRKGETKREEFLIDYAIVIEDGDRVSGGQIQKVF